MIKYLLIIFITLFSSICYGGDSWQAPHCENDGDYWGDVCNVSGFLHPTNGDNSIIHFSCNGLSSPGQFDCNFEQKMLVINNKELTKKEINIGLANITKNFSKVKKRCLEMKNNNWFNPSIIALKNNKYKTLALKEDLQRQKDICKCETPKCIIEITIKEERQKPCKIFINTWNISFKKLNNYLYEHRDTNRGMCNLMVYTSLEYFPEKDEWIFTQKRISTKSGDKMCSRFESTIVDSSNYKYSSDLKVDCDRISLY